VTATADAAHAGHAVIGPGGGAVETTATDGTHYALTVPRGALRTPTTITLTPLTALTGLPGPVTLVAGVQGAPDGLQFQRPATLTSELAHPPGPVLGLPVPDEGTGVTWWPVPQHGTTLTLPVTHFSAIAIPRTETQLLTRLAGTTPSSQATQFLLTATTTWQPADAAAVRDSLRQWCDTELVDHLTSAADVAATGDTRLAALAELYRWESLRSPVESWLGHLEVNGTRLPGHLTTLPTTSDQPVRLSVTFSCRTGGTSIFGETLEPSGAFTATKPTSMGGDCGLGWMVGTVTDRTLDFRWTAVNPNTYFTFVGSR
jgi:hypothetical protein